MTTRDTDVRGKYTGLQTKSQYPAKALWARNTAFWGPHSLLPVHTQDWASRRGGSGSGVPENERTYDASLRGTGEGGKMEGGSITD